MMIFQSSNNKHQKNISILYNTTYPFFIAYYQICLTDVGSCCNFISRLTIDYVSLHYNNTTVSCIEHLYIHDICLQKNATLSKQSCTAIFMSVLHLHINKVYTHVSMYIKISTVCNFYACMI